MKVKDLLEILEGAPQDAPLQILYYHENTPEEKIECDVHDCVNYGRYIGGNDGTSGKPQTFVTSFTSLEVVGRTKPCEE